MPTSLQQGINAAKAGQTETALMHLKDAIIEEPQNADVWVWISAIIDNPEKQEIFLNKALEIDPQNIPAQRGLSYLQKRKQHNAHVKGETLSDHTQPISPFPKTERDAKPAQHYLDVQEKSDEQAGLPAQSASNDSQPVSGDQPQPIQRLTTLEIVLLSIVVIVFAFIGLLASSALFDFDLPWGVLAGNQPSLVTDPPYPGAFLYENEVYFDIQAHDGPPVANVGIPTSSSSRPVIVFWQFDVEMSRIKLIHESGSYMNYRTFQRGRSAELIQPSAVLQNGLYCLQETHPSPPPSSDTYYCFQIDHTQMD